MVEPVDRYAQGDPECVVYLPGRGSLIGLYIKGVPYPSMLGIREDADGQIVSCAITTELRIEHPPAHGYGVVRDEEDGN